MLSYKSSTKHEQLDEWISLVSLSMYQPSQAQQLQWPTRSFPSVARLLRTTLPVYIWCLAGRWGRRIYTERRATVLPLETASCSEIRQQHTVLSPGYALTSRTHLPILNFQVSATRSKISTIVVGEHHPRHQMLQILLLRVTNIFS